MHVLSSHDAADLTSPIDPPVFSEPSPSILTAILQAIFDGAHQSIMLIDRQYKLLSFNRSAQAAAKQLFGKEMRIGHSMKEYIAPEDQDQFNARFQKALSGEPQVVEKQFNAINDFGWWELSFEPIAPLNGEIPGVTCIARNITERVRATQLQEGQRRFFENLAGSKPLREILNTLVDTVEMQLADGLCSIMLIDAEGKRLLAGAAPSLPETYSRAIEGMAIGPYAGSCGTAAFYGEPVCATDIMTDPHWASYRDLAGAHGLRACWSVPFHDSRGNVLGTLATYYRDPRAPNVAELELLKSAADMAAIAVERKRAEEEIRALNAELDQRVIAQLQEAIASIKSLSGMLPICAACKKIRDDSGYWNQIETYIREHSDADFSHGICPDCSQELYSELYTASPG